MHKPETVSYKLIEDFFKKNKLEIESLELIHADVVTQNRKINISDRNSEIVLNTIVDIYSLNSENIKNISSILRKNNIKLGRVQKDLLKEYLDYKRKEIFNLLTKSILNNLSISPDAIYIKEIIDKNYDSKSLYLEAVNLFLENWRKSKDDSKKRKDLLLGLYIRLHSNIEAKEMLASEIFLNNENNLKKELDKKQLNELKKFSEKDKSKNGIDSFYTKYTQILKKDIQQKSIESKLDNELNQYFFNKDVSNKKYIYDSGNAIELLRTEEYSLVALNIDQAMFNSFSNKIEFYNDIFKQFKQVYRVLENYKVFSVKIENIYEGNRNIKWEIYSYLGVFSENLFPKKEKRIFFKPEVLSNDMLPVLKLTPSKETEIAFKNYFKGTITIGEFSDKINYLGELKDLKKFIDEYSSVYYGYTFNDLYIIRENKKRKNFEIPFIEDETSLNFIFYKYRIDNRKIPCPSCGGLNVSGNSYPDIGHKSWECKNLICPSRSKSNRGKRYSYKTNYMQKGISIDEKISPELIKKWRKDIVTTSKETDLTEMLLNYFTFKKEKVLFINFNTKNIFNLKSTEHKKIILNKNKENFININKQDIYKSPKGIESQYINSFNEFTESSFMKRFLVDLGGKKNSDIDLNKFITKDNSVKLIEGDCLNALSLLKANSIAASVTSPPYYNARDYSQWNNLYLYLIDMYKIVSENYRVLKKGGIYLYNIGDISGNENTIVKSTMGKKRMLLGAYTIQIFLKAGYELIENILWDKGEPQSQRQHNDGKFTPHYQKPVNSYEHMFIFKKPGSEIKISEKIVEKWNTNIVSFPPVIKINSKGENLFGHTAPFPKDIPNFVCKKFTHNESDIVLDPFSGALTSAISAYENDRIGLGVELSNEYVNLSKKRAEIENIPLNIINIK